MISELEGKTILITGGSGSLGKVLISNLLNYRCRVIAITSKILGKIELESEFSNYNFQCVCCDLTNCEETVLICKEIDAKERIEVIINCIGNNVDGNIDELSYDDFTSVFNTNFLSIYHVIKLFLPGMKSRNNGGVIINIASTLGGRAVPNCIAYSTAKAAVIHFSRCLSLEVAPWNIRVNCISPGYFASNLTNKLLSSRANLEQLVNKIPLNRLLDVNTIVPLVVLMISDAGAYMTGGNVVIDGGISNC